MILDGNFYDRNSSECEWKVILDEVIEKGLTEMLVIGFSGTPNRMQHERIDENPGKDISKVIEIINKKFNLQT